MKSENNSDLFISEFPPEFVDRWDELIDWEKRRQAEGGFFESILNNSGARTVLDIACGTGYHTVTLKLNGFEVTGSDGSANMVNKAKENTEQFGIKSTRLVEAQWDSLSAAFPEEKFDSIICLGNSFAHLFDDDARRQALDEIYGMLDDGDVLVIDHRNYDAMLDKGFSSKKLYYFGDTVNVQPDSISEEVVRLSYFYADGSVHHLTLCPYRQEHLTTLLLETGFQLVELYGDFKVDHSFYDPDLII